MKKVVLMVSLLLFPRLLVAHELDIRSLTGEHWYGLYMNGQKAGYSMTGVGLKDDGSVIIREDAAFKIVMSGVAQDMRIVMLREYGPEGDLKRIDQEVQDPAGPKRFVAVVSDGELSLITEISGKTVTNNTLPKPRESLGDALKQARLVGPDAKVGDTLTFSVFEPMYAKEIAGTSKILGVETQVLEGVPTQVFQVASTMPDLGVDSVAYVAQDGTTLEDTFGGILKMRLEPKEMAQSVEYVNDVIVSNAAKADRRVDSPRTRESLRLLVTGPLTEDHVFNDERQTMTKADGGYEFTGRMPTVDPAAAPALPVTEPSVAQWVKPSTFVQSDDARLIDKAREVIGDETNSFEVSKKLCQWVYQNVRTTFSAQLSNALEVLERPEGDCTEHSILFIGLARAAGLPAREVAGLIYVQEAEPAFYFHQWAQVWVGKWVDVDPTFNQPLADTTHIKLGQGDLFEQARLIPVIGQIGIKVLD